MNHDYADHKLALLFPFLIVFNFLSRELWYKTIIKIEKVLLELATTCPETADISHDSEPSEVGQTLHDIV